MKAFASTLVLLYLTGGSGAARQETREDAIIRKASFVISAWSCAATGKGTKAENERIFNAGLEVGHEVLQFMKNATDAQQKAIGPHIPMIWMFAQGPTDDFRLGRLYGAVEDEQMDNDVLNKHLDPDWHKTKPADWEVRKAEIWRAKNCQHLANADVK